MSAAPQDPFLKDTYLSQHDSEMQQKLRKLRPWPVGCVFIEHPGMTEEDIRGHFKLMKELGFTALKQCQTRRGTDNKQVMHWALEEGIIPWWYGEAGFEDPTPELLTELGIDPEISPEDLRVNQTWLDRQMKIMHDRVDGKEVAPVIKDDRPKPNVPGVQLTFDFELIDKHIPLFIDWLKEKYETIEGLNDAWNLHHTMCAGPLNTRWEPGQPIGWASWEHLAGEVMEIVNKEKKEYRRIADVLRFKADIYLQRVKANTHAKWMADKNIPHRAGGEMGLFLPFASRGTDMEGIAEVMKEYGSFYPSFHLAWHFEEVDFETVRPYYMQSSIVQDWFKGGWAATWESTGGPQQMTGHKAPFVPKVRDLTPGFTVDEGIMRQLMFSWMAGGFKGFGIWSWSVRTQGWEGGEFGLLDRNNEPTDRAVIAGKIGKACRELRDELWSSQKEPFIGIFQDWDMESIWAASSIAGRDKFKSEPIRARIGAARSLINGNLPWEHVTYNDLKGGLLNRYKTIILPACLALDEAMLDMLLEYVEGGGRVILDAPGAWFNYGGRLHSTAEGSSFEKLFGAKIPDYQYSREGNRVWRISGMKVEGCTFDIQPTTAEVLETFDHSTPAKPKPAITTNKIGDGEAIIMGFEASLMTCAPGAEAVEAMIRKYAMGEEKAPYSCAQAIVYRLATEAADHYFFMNDRDCPVHARLLTPAYEYQSSSDPVTEESLTIGEPITIEAHSARWVRFEK